VERQCELLELSRSTLYYKPYEIEERQKIKTAIVKDLDEIYTAHPFYGKRRLCHELQLKGHTIGVKQTRSYMKHLGLEAIYPRPKATTKALDHKIYPYLLRNMKIERRNQVWSTDITYIRMKQGWIYLVAIIDWHTRFVLTWETSTTLEKDFCILALKRALTTYGSPTIFNTDQGSQFTSLDFTNVLDKAGIQISMDGKGRCLDNIFVERLWRSVKYEEVYLKSYETVKEANNGLSAYFQFYDYKRPHQSLDYKTPAQVYFGETSK
jgi:putative transposase